MTAQVHTLRPPAGMWTVAGSRTRVTFTVRNFGRPVHGSVDCRGGELEVDEAGSPVRVSAELDLETLHTGNARRDADLRKPALLDIDRHPTMTWTADRFVREDEGRWAADGVLSVRGSSAPLRVRGDVDIRPDGWVRVRASASIDRTAVGIRAPRILIGRAVDVAVDAWLSRPPHD